MQRPLALAALARVARHLAAVPPAARLRRAAGVTLLFCATVARAGDWTAIDSHALAAAPADERDVSSLARYLGRAARSDAERLRAAYRWVSDRITYDAIAYRDRQAEFVEADQVLASRKAVCGGFVKLYTELARELGVRTRVIRGYAKEPGHEPGREIPAPNHSWIAVQIDGQWRFIDPTWGAGTADADGHADKQFSEFEFLAEPDAFAFTHYPSREDDFLYSQRFSKQQFERLSAPVERLVEFGVAPGLLLGRAVTPGFDGFAEAFDVPAGLVRDLHVPLDGRLAAGPEHDFELNAPEADDVALIDGDRWLHFEREGAHFRLRSAVGAGRDVQLALHLPGRPAYLTFMRYGVTTPAGLAAR
ncbi:transglutaminase domain-containing protein [Derxia gummosa]|uniref:Transglutaminase domain-containing protein n=1 Tax=Derxia gummosa DSM 723 TaxID=1121388 RepID=A0A8B6X231_9BURK|nr:transglutaminase domain-containing protein [Derxia gummosa]